MGKLLTIVYEAQGSTAGTAQSWSGENADIVEKTLFEAEQRGALVAHFKIDNTDYWLRTDKYLYWCVDSNYEGF